MIKSLRQLLEEYERDILMRIDPVRKELVTLERALADVRRARNAIVHEGIVSAAADAMRSRLHERIYQHTVYLDETTRHVDARDKTPPAEGASPYSKLSMKQLTRKALAEHFQNGATANELLDFFRDAWGRNDIIRSSLSPQLSRLKREGVIRLDGKTWHLVGDDEPLLLGGPDTVQRETGADQ